MKIEVTQINSTAVRKLTYVLGAIDRAEQEETNSNELTYGELVIEYANGSEYVYYDVLLGTFTDLLNASSIGRAVNEDIKPVHRYDKLATANA
jgi:KTSC domain